ncbi:hypothetical protein COY87_05655 [Candidatus Roizmanbacteria bacterium CG_4_10_14_0_8_um_filter_33_9]|uniref:Core-binding (CB) domain-containing protein n=1 Tax=Candidatus Roizmanbacteria bacterium CG_4_10_14_0_8_um_filter_33_9 TaxID=1974826 RepID=A0A2M7QI47_9BACT|nr:MAG: hypothetical protein COY87_05655 [Candidatus Roizmanbacteria bacterium CG_4_10_14_0_8_um_filter_33_9]
MNNQYNLTHFESTFREFLILEKVAPVTIKNYLSDLRHFLGWLPIFLKTKNVSVTLKQVYTEKIPNQVLDMIRSVQHDTIQDYSSYLSQNQTPFKSINRRLSTLRKFFSFCISQGWMSHNPAKKVTNIFNIRHPEFISGSSQVSGMAHSNNLILTTDIIEKTQLSEKELLTKYRDSLQNTKLNEKEILQIMSDLKEFFTIINFRPKADPVIYL